ncbi:MAG TPA: glycosyltransferase family 2 protein [Opitutaceae bacterium]|jgi:glycosyltransferase involved in cell wall biosynthesis|nr:glycosyltransferase family 2 protein [Opitutaceae bacterium]
MTANGLLTQLPAVPPGRTGWPWTEETLPDRYATPPASGQWPKLSIVCPSFRQGRFIEETIRSVLLQNYPALEFIVIDGGSDDETVPILKKYSPWLAHWESEPDRGQSHALNKGFGRATGDLFGWINSDDYYQPGAFAAVAARYRPGRRELFFGDYDVRWGEETLLRRERLLPAFAFQVAVGGRILPSHTTFWPRLVHLSFNESLQFIMDADFFKRLACAGIRPRHLAQPLAVFRAHPAAKTSTLVNVGQAENEAWIQAQSWPTWWLWLLSRVVDRLRRFFGS